MMKRFLLKNQLTQVYIRHTNTFSEILGGCDSGIPRSSTVDTPDVIKVN